MLDVAIGAPARSRLARVHLGREAQRAERLLQRGWLRVDVHKHEGLAAPAEARLHQS